MTILIKALLYLMGAPFVLVGLIIKGIIKLIETIASTQKEETIAKGTEEKVKKATKDTRIFPNKTKESIKNEANEKYSYITETKKKHLLKQRRKELKTRFAIFASIAFVVGVLTLLCLIGTDNFNVACLIVGIAFLILGIGLVVMLKFKLKRTEEILILEQLIRDLTSLYNQLTYDDISEHKDYVKRRSNIYQAMLDLNNKYHFDRELCKQHNFKEILNSKRQVENFDYEKWIFQKMAEKPEFFRKLEMVYEDNIKLYDEYLSEYQNICNFKKESEYEDLELEYEIFNYIEKEIYKESKQKAIIKPSIALSISYTSPTGRNHYSDKYVFTYEEIKQQFRNKLEKDKELLLERQKKEDIVQAKKEKERKLRELDKIEKRLTEKEQEIIEKEKEFLEATKEHIYTADRIEVKSTEVEIDEDLSLSQKLKLLRTKFDNGEITYEEYQAKRKDLM